MFLKLSVAASRRGWKRLSSILLELDLIFSGLGGASHRIRKDRARRRKPTPQGDRRMINTVIGAGFLLTLILVVATIGGPG